MKKFILALLVVLSLFTFTSCSIENAVLDYTESYEITSEIHSLDVRIKAADFKIEAGESLLVESNLKYLSVTQDNGVLEIIDNAKINSSFINAFLTIYIPSELVFNDVDIQTGAAKLTVGSLSTDTIDLTLGAGDLYVNNLSVSSHAEIKGGAGQIVVEGGVINDLTLNMGVGALTFSAKLLGNSNLNFGVGKSNIILIGKLEDYKLEIRKGIGKITVDGESINDSNNLGNGQNRVKIIGGVGAIDITLN